ncbi:MAG: hypothetical protein AAF677_17505, partial [Pseudomonadota bacterium]
MSGRPAERGAQRVAPATPAPAARAEGPFAPGARVGVVVPMPFDQPLDYRVPDGPALYPGDFVAARIGPRRVLGVVWGPGDGQVAEDRVKPLDARLDAPPMRPEMRRFIDRAADYTMTPLGMMLRLATRVPDLGAAPRLRRVLDLTETRPARLTPARARVLAAAEALGGRGLVAADLARAAAVTSSVV